MPQRLSRELAQILVTAAEAGEWLPVGPERNRVKYLLPERIDAGEWLCLIGFDEMDEDAADILTRHKGRLTLSELICLSDTSAQSLSLHQGGVLELDGLTSLSDPAAQSLSKYQGFLCLDGITTLTDVAAGALAQQQGGLSLDGLTTLSDTPGHLALARKLAAQPRSARNCFKSLINISETVAEILVDLPDILILDSLHLTEPVATILAKHSDGLRFMHATSITHGVARALAKCEGYLVLDVGPSLSPSIARELATHRTGLSLSGLTCISEATADVLAEHEGRLILSCFSLAAISDGAARSLARHKGPLILNYSGNLPASAAEILGPHVESTDDD
jgi:hypothetical protein